MPKFLAIILTLLAPINLFAEYRVYQYAVKNRTIGAGESGLGKADQVTYIVTSTLDPVSYLAYHGGPDSLGLDLMKSWMCKGHTGTDESYCAGTDAQGGTP